MNSVAERNAGDQLAGERVAHFLRRRAVGVGEHGVLQARSCPARGRHWGRAGCRRRPRGIRRDCSNTRTGKALPRQRIGRDQAADAAAGDQKRRRAAIRCWPCFGVSSPHCLWLPATIRRPPRAMTSDAKSPPVDGRRACSVETGAAAAYFVSWPRISPPLLAAVWTLTYMSPSISALAWASLSVAEPSNGLAVRA